MSTLDVEIVCADPGEHVKSFAARLLITATMTGGPVLGEFNQHTLEAHPGDSLEKVLSPWIKWAKENYDKPFPEWR